MTIFFAWYAVICSRFIAMWTFSDFITTQARESFGFSCTAYPKIFSNCLNLFVSVEWVSAFTSTLMSTWDIHPIFQLLSCNVCSLLSAVFMHYPAFCVEILFAFLVVVVVVCFLFFFRFVKLDSAELTSLTLMTVKRLGCQVTVKDTKAKMQFLWCGVPWNAAKSCSFFSCTIRRR